VFWNSTCSGRCARRGEHSDGSIVRIEVGFWADEETEISIHEEHIGYHSDSNCIAESWMKLDKLHEVR